MTALLPFVAGAQYHPDTLAITAPSGQTLLCIHHYYYNSWYTLMADTANLSGDLVVPHEIVWPYTDSDGQIHYPVYTVTSFNFDNCRHLHSAVVQEGYTSVRFNGCTSLETVQLPSTITHIGNLDLAGCSSLQSINIPDGVEYIGNGAFQGCSSLDSVVMPESVDSICSYAFRGCSSLTSITIPQAVHKLPEGAFDGCSSLTSVVLPDSLLELGSYGYYIGEIHAYGIPDAHLGAFSRCTSLASITLPSTLQTLGSNTFYGCTSLANVNFPAGVERLGDFAFYGCGFTELTIPNSVKKLDYGVFRRCVGLQELTVSDSLQDIGYCSFDSCTSLTTVNFNAQHCESHIWYATGTGDLESAPFVNCPNLVNINIGEGVESIGEKIFAFVSALEEVTIPASVREIHGWAFLKCRTLETVYYNADSATMCPLSTGASNGGQWLSECFGLKRIVLGDNVTVIPEGFAKYRRNLHEIVIPPSVRTIGASAFAGCKTVDTKLVIPDSVVSIGYSAFCGCYFDTIVLGSSLVSIGDYAFGNNDLYGGTFYCTDTVLNIPHEACPVDVVYINAATPPQLGYRAFGTRLFDLYVPCGTGEAYRNSIWHGFGSWYWNNGMNNIEDPLMEISVEADANGIVEIMTAPTCESDTATFRAIADSTYLFSHWSDGDTSNPRTLVLTRDTTLTAFFERNCDAYNISAPYVADFSECWATTGNAHIDSLGRGAVPGQGDTLFSPWMNVDSNTYAVLRWVQTDASASPSVWYLTIRNREGEVLQNHWMRTDYQNQRWWIGDCAGQEVRFEFTHSASEAQPAEFAVTEMKLFSYHLRTTVNGPDTVYVGDTATFNVLVDQESNSTLFYSWYIWDGGTAIGSTGQTDLPSFSVTWDEPGVYRVYNDVTAALYNQPVVGYQSAIWTITRYITVLDTTPITPVDCDSITLPYFADFTQCWTATGGATIINSNLTKLDGYGQTLTSPWILLGDEGSLFYDYWYYRDTASGVSSWEYLDDGVQYSIYIRTQDGTLHNIMIYGDRARFSRAGYRNTLGNVYNGQLIQVVIKYEETSGSVPVFFSPLTLDQSTITATITAPVTASVGDTVVISGIASLPAGAVANESSWWITNSNGDWLSLDANDSVFSVVFQSDSCKTLVWHMPGQYEVNLHVSHGIAYARATHSIFIIDTVTVDCDSISLPYTADFTQCWTAEGAVVIDPNHVSMISVGQKITGPWMESNAGKAFLHFTFNCDNNHEWNSDQTARITIENEDGVFASWEEVVGNWSGLYDFESPGGSIRVKLEYTGSQPCIDFMVSDVLLYSYQIENNLEGPGIVHVGDTVTFTAHATLQDDEMADYYDWYMYVYNSNGSSWVDENDPSRTIVSRTDSTLVVVWNTPGRYSVTSSVYKNNVYHNSNAYASDWMYINVVDFPFYEEDSIYYTSAAKDTVIGCHSELHVANLPESVTVIADSAFFNLSNLSIIELPIGLRTIGKMAFAWNQGISEITIPQNVTFVGDNAFWWDTNLTTVNFNATNCQTMSPSTDNNGNYWPVFIGCNNITTINIGENVTRIPDRAFSYCSGLHGTLTIPDAVTYIGRSAFFHWIDDWDWENGSSWDTLSIVLGTGLTEIGDYAFGCPRAHITSVISHNPEPPIIGEQTFYRYEPEYTPRLQVPCGSAAAYRNAQHWSRIEEITEDCDKIEDVIVEDNIKIYVCDGRIVVEGSGDNTVQVFDMMGRLVVAEETLYGGLGLSVPSSGVYMVKIGGMPACKVVVMR